MLTFHGENEMMDTVSVMEHSSKEHDISERAVVKVHEVFATYMIEREAARGYDARQGSALVG